MKSLQHRCNILVRANEGIISLREAATQLNLSYRHTRRLFSRFLNGGKTVESLAYKRTHPAPNRIPDPIRQKILNLHKAYSKANNYHLAEIAQDLFNIKVHPTTIRSILIQANHYEIKAHKKRRPRKRYEKKAFGELVHIDTSEHLWIPKLKKRIYLILLLDDFSRHILAAKFFTSNTTWNNMLMIRQAIRRYGLFSVFYSDNASMFKLIRTGYSRHFDYRTDLEKVQTEIHRALLDLNIILLHHPVGAPFCKGKIERIFGFMQNRLPVLLQDCQSIEEANKILAKWVKWYNTKHVNSITRVIPCSRLQPSVTKPLPKDLNMDDIFCFKLTRTVKKDNTFNYQGNTYQITHFDHRAYWGNTQVELHVVPNKCIRVFYKGKFIQQFWKKSKSP